MRLRAITLATLASVSVIGIGAQLGAQLTASQQAPENSARVAGTTTSTTSHATNQTPKTAPSASPSVTAAAPPAPSGTVDGSVVHTRFGPVQVSVTIANGTITEVTALQLTNDGGRSVMISNRAAPILRNEVLAAQSAQVQNVSGATYTTNGYLTSLQAALDAATF